ALRVRPAGESEWLTCGAGSSVSACVKYADTCRQRIPRATTRTTIDTTTAGQPKAVMAHMGSPDSAIASRLLHNLSLSATADDVKKAKEEAEERQVKLNKSTTKLPADEAAEGVRSQGAHPAAIGETTLMPSAELPAGQTPNKDFDPYASPEVAVVSRFLLGLPSNASVEDVKKKESENKLKLAECKKESQGVDCEKPPAETSVASLVSRPFGSETSSVHPTMSQAQVQAQANTELGGENGANVSLRQKGGVLSDEAARGAAAAHGHEGGKLSLEVPPAVPDAHDAGAPGDHPTTPQIPTLNKNVDGTGQEVVSTVQRQQGETGASGAAASSDGISATQPNAVVGTTENNSSANMDSNNAITPNNEESSATNNSLTETSNESNAAESVVTNITNDAENTTSNEELTNATNTNTTTNTTTTTTFPPVPTTDPQISNIASTVQKNANADSSSISSSLWMRVPLLIVVTLACILVY
ncbi:uncharacterized protein TM35_000113060, partial [Trypanosoma theileri]